MTIRPRAARALLDARTKLRDIAAATHAQTTAVRDRKHLALVEEQTRLEDHFDDAADILASAGSVHDIDRVGETTGVYRIAIADAAEAHTAATTASDTTGAKLRDSARRLRTAEAIVERIHTERNIAAGKAEQRASDDLVAARRR